MSLQTASRKMTSVLWCNQLPTSFVCNVQESRRKHQKHYPIIWSIGTWRQHSRRTPSLPCRLIVFVNLHTQNRKMLFAPRTQDEPFKRNAQCSDISFHFELNSKKNFQLRVTSSSVDCFAPLEVQFLPRRYLSPAQALSPLSCSASQSGQPLLSELPRSRSQLPSGERSRDM